MLGSSVEGTRVIVPGARVIEPGSSMKFETGDWRTMKPVLEMDKCIHCLTCWIYCPDDCVLVSGGKVEGFRLTHCKGCGICSKTCPKDAIKMVLG